MKKWRANLLLLMTALIWGLAFSAQSAAMAYIGPWTFNCVRFLIGGLTLLALTPLLERISGEMKPAGREEKKHLFKAGLLCGLFLCAASMFQQAGIQYTTAGKAGFLTALYVIFVPLISLFFGKKTMPKVWIAAFIALCGFYFLSVTESFTVGYGDILLVMCAVIFAGHILIIDHFAGSVSGVKLSCIQFFTASLLCAGPMLAEHPSVSLLESAAVPLLYAGVLSCGAGYTLQIIGQKEADPAIAAMILSLESVFSVLGGYVLLHQVLTPRELLGCALVFAGVILSQLPDTKKTD